MMDMTLEERNRLVLFCIGAVCDIEGINLADVSLAVFDNFTEMSPEELRREADWFEDMLGK